MSNRNRHKARPPKQPFTLSQENLMLKKLYEQTVVRAMAAEQQAEEVKVLLGAVVLFAGGEVTLPDTLLPQLQLMGGLNMDRNDEEGSLTLSFDIEWDDDEEGEDPEVGDDDGVEAE